MANAPIESKVYAGTIGATAGTVVGTLVLWLLGVTIWHASGNAVHATDAVAAVPGPVTGFVLLVVAAGGSFIGGYFARHTPRLLDAEIPVVTDGTEVPAPVEVDAPLPDQVDPADTTNDQPPDQPVDDSGPLPFDRGGELPQTAGSPSS